MNRLTQPRATWRALSAMLALALALTLGLPAAAGAAEQRYLDESFAVKVKRDLTYGNAGGEELRLDLYRPKGDDVRKRPAVIWVHGGGFAGGDKAEGPSPQLARHFARLGYVTASINYRLLAPGGCSGASGVTPECFTAAIEATHDAQAAVRYLRANRERFRVDPKRIGIGGESAGAIVSCGVGVLEDDPGASGNPGPSSAVQAFVSISGGLPGGLFVDADSAPGLLVASTGDPLVPYEWSVQTFDALRANGVLAKLTTFEGDEHVPFESHRDLIERQSERRLYHWMGVAGAQGA